METDHFTRELWQVQWRIVDPIDLYVVRPKGVAKPPVILYLYSYDSDIDRFKNDRYCERITAGGYAAVGFVSALSGHRYHTRPMKEWFVSELQESLGSSVHDVQMILNYLESRKDLDMDHVGMFGQGSGGTIAILAAAVDPRIKAVDTFDPWGDWSDWLAQSSIIPEAERPLYLNPEFLAKVRMLDPVTWLPQVKAKALRLQFMAGATATPDIVQEHLAAAAPKAATVVHYKDREDLLNQADGGKLFDWIKKQLATPASDPKLASMPVPSSNVSSQASAPAHEEGTK